MLKALLITEEENYPQPEKRALKTLLFSRLFTQGALAPALWEGNFVT